jgi:HemY protein
MIRVVFFLVATTLAAWGAVWVADRPGDVAINWLGYHLETPIGVVVAALAAALLVFAVLVIAGWSAYRRLFSLPDFFAVLIRRRRVARGYAAITRGLIAVGAGDPYAARRFAREAHRFVSDEPLALLLGAQSAQLAGNRAVAEQMFQLMAAREDTRLIGLHGLFVEAQRRDDSAAARLHAEEAARNAPSLAWASGAVLEYRCASGDWTGALEALERNLQHDLVARPAYRRQRAVLLTARALSLIDTDRDSARSMILEAVKLAPDLVPAVSLAGRLLAEAGEQRRAARLIERAWRANPHPDLAEVYAHLRPGDSARDRLARVQALARLAEGHLESAYAVARSAIDAREFTVARTNLAPFLGTPTQRVAMLMAEIEDLEHGDVGRAREWIAKALNAERDPAWTADGVVSDKWLPISPVTGRLDAFQWKVPLAHLGAPVPVIEERLFRTVVPDAVESVAPERPQEIEQDDIKPVPHENKALSHEKVPDDGTQQTSPTPAPTAVIPSVAFPARRPDAVIPLIHVPDDPGPEGEREEDPIIDRQGQGWRRLRGLFW